MKKPSDDINSIYAIYKGGDAETINELCQSTGLGESAIRRHANDMVKRGVWKAVNVRRDNRIMSAYIKVK